MKKMKPKKKAVIKKKATGKKPAKKKAFAKKIPKAKVLSKKLGKTFKKTKSAKPIGMVTHFYNEIKVAIVKFKQPVRVGAELNFKGATTDFNEVIKSMQFNHEAIMVAPKGKQIGIKVKKRVRQGDAVYEV